MSTSRWPLLLMVGWAWIGHAMAADQGAAFQPPETMPAGPFGEMVAKGERIFQNTPAEAQPYAGNALACRNCHLDRGRLADSSPLWAGYVRFPQWRAKNRRVETLAQRLQDCFRYSMNGTPPPLDSEVLVALQSYMFWLASGAPTGGKMEGRGYPGLADPDRPPDPARGAQVFIERCALCHGADGQGIKVGDRYAFPPLWGPQSYNWGSGMQRVPTLASFVKANMPLGLGGSLTEQQAWDVAAFVDSRPRPQDPRFTGDLTETSKRYHDNDDFYGKIVDGVLLGAPGPIR